MGRVSRDARLLFVMIWTICDDEGRTRAASRMLASLLFPYDDDAPRLIDDWIAELEREKCVARYVVDGATYLQICNWLNHQKIDKPSRSRIPEFDESSRILANPRERSSEDMDLGSRIKDQEEDLEEYLSDADASDATDPPPPVRPVRIDHPGFDEFYAAYPKHEAKADAEKAWRQVKPDLETLLADIRARIDSRHWSDPKFIPLPATYLRGKRWEDSIRPGAPSKSSQQLTAEARRQHNLAVLGVAQ
jgi:hypothetical protein